MPEIFDASKQKASERNHTSDHKKAHSPEKEVEKKQRVRKHVDEYSETMRMESVSHNPLNAYAAKPHKVSFETQATDEEVLLLLRKHPILLLKPIFIIIIGLIIPTFLFANPVLAFLSLKFNFAFMVVWYLLLLGYALEAFLAWFFNVYIVTDERVIDVDFLSIVQTNISSAKIDNIEDVTATKTGVLATVVDYGTVTMQTAAEKREFEFEDVPHPGKVTALLNELILEEEREKLEGRVN